MPTAAKRLRLLREVYAALPPVHCKGLCVASCANIPLLDVEVLHIKTATGAEPRLVDIAGHKMLAPADEHGRCPYLLLGRCSIYEQRPLICRVFGADPGLACPHGCQPESPLETGAVAAMLRRIERL